MLAASTQPCTNEEWPLQQSVSVAFSEPLGEDHLPTPATLPSMPEDVELAATAMRATDSTEEDQREDDYENVSANEYRVLLQDKYVDRQELILK